MQKITILDEIKHIRTRPGMYIGNGENITHLIEELLDNALDEVSNKYATTVALVKNKNIYTIIDNGRGLPIYFESTYNQDIAALLFMKLFSGGKFNEDNYKVRIGAHGVGLTVVNALSDFLNITIYHDTKTILNQWSKYTFKDISKKSLSEYNLVKVEYKFVDGIMVDKVVEYTNQSKPFSTAISFSPNKQYFQNLEYDKQFIEHRLKIASIFTGTKILWRENDQDILISETLDHYFKKIFQFKESIYSPVINLKHKNKITLEGFDITLTWNLQDSSYQWRSSINLLPVSDGAHINAINLMLQNLFLKFNKSKKYKFNKSDCLIGLRYYCNLYILDPYLEGQTKEKLANNKKNKDKLQPFIQILEIQLESYFKENLQLVDQLMTKFEQYRMMLSSKKTTRNLVGNSNIRGITSKDSRLKDCTNKDNVSTELLICEGESASGSLVKCRNYKKHAILPLKGKTINVISSNLEKVLKNKEILDIIRSIGVGIKVSEKDKLDMSKIRYGKIILVADADPDGGHILSLLMMAFLKFIPDVIKQGYVYICLPPLYALRNKTQYIPFYSSEEFIQYKQEHPDKISKYSVIRYKGLGEMNPEEMKVVAMDSTRKLIKLKFPESESQITELENLFTTSIYRKKLLEELINVELP